jgi:hypothetical protein
MPTPGHTAFGKSLNKIESAANTSLSNSFNNKVHCKITEAVGEKNNEGQYSFYVDVMAEVKRGVFVKIGTAGPIFVDSDPDMLSVTVGAPEDQKQDRWLEVSYNGRDINKGKARFIADPTKSKTLASLSNSVDHKGTACFPPGSGIM